MSDFSNLKIGVLALQGDFEAHRATVTSCGAQVVAVREAAHLEGCHGLVIPGGESTTMSRLCDRYQLWEPLRDHIARGMGVLGTCAGLIMMARHIEGATANFAQHTLGVLDVTVARNAYGAQLDSFEADVSVPALGEAPVRAVFIRAPRITRVGDGVDVLARYGEAPVVVQSAHLLALAFHPEIAGDARFHSYWLSQLKESA